MTPKADVLRVQDVRGAYRLIGECRDLGSDPALWQQRMMDGLSHLFGEVAASGGEGQLAGAEGGILPLSYFESGFDAPDLPTYHAYMREGGPAVDPFVRALLRPGARTVTRTRGQMVADRVYFRSPLFERYFQPGNVGDRVASIFPTAGGGTFGLLHLHRRPRGDRDFSSRERALLEFFHGEVGPLVGRALVSVAEPTPENLSAASPDPRLPRRGGHREAGCRAARREPHHGA